MYTVTYQVLRVLDLPTGKSSSKFFLSAKCELAIFYVFGGKASEQESLHRGLLSELEMRGKRIRV